LAGHSSGIDTQPGVGAGGEAMCNAGVAIEAYFIADKGRALDHWGRNDAPVNRRARIQ